jgi:hypothetical protein
MLKNPPPPPTKSLIYINLTPAEDEKSEKNQKMVCSS